MTTREAVLELDAQDPLAKLRSRFTLPDATVYLDGNSLGPLPANVEERIARTLSQEWGKDLITSWNAHNWIDLPAKVGEKIAPLIGAASGQVICADSISVNIHKLLCCCLALRRSRRQILAPADNFPTDLYMVEGLQSLPGAGAPELRTVAEADLAASIDENTAAVLFSHVNFRTGAILPAAEICEAAHAMDALVIIDLAHSAGVLPVELDSWGTDFAVGCGYKFLNGGPGAPAFVYAADRHQELCHQPLSGWMGHARPFDFSPTYEAAKGIERFLCGTPPIISMAALDAALELFEDIDMRAVHSKSQQLTQLYIDLLMDSRIADEIHLLSPSTPEHRGSQVAISHPEAYALCQALIERNIIMDFRDPNILRAGFSPLANRFLDVWEAVTPLVEILESGYHQEPRFQVRKTVT